MCDSYHEDRIKTYGFCSVCHVSITANVPDPTIKEDKPKNNKKRG